MIHSEDSKTARIEKPSIIEICDMTKAGKEKKKKKKNINREHE
jgi:hypothetical protein